MKTALITIAMLVLAAPTFAIARNYTPIPQQHQTYCTTDCWPDGTHCVTRCQ